VSPPAGAASRLSEAAFGYRRRVGANVPRVSVGLPVYNGEAYLASTLDSILNQTLTDFELVISDNASTDATSEICTAYAAEDGRIKYTRNDRNIGGARNYNRVFALASAPYFTWHAHDDLIGERYLERCLEPLEKDSSVALSYPKISYIDADGETIGHQTIDDLSIMSPEPADRIRRLMTFEMSGTDIFWAGAFGVNRRGVLEKTQLLGGYNAADQVLVLQILLRGKFAQVNDPLYFRRDHPDASMAANSKPMDVLRWFDPDIEKRFVLPHWKLFAEHIASVHRARLGVAAELRADYHVLRRFRKEWRNFPGDVKLAARDFVAVT
jgi:glycosyltransferase involved in cell wall biosynthesis